MKRNEVIKTLVLAPDKHYTRISEGSFIRLKNGNILFAFSRFQNGYEDDSPSNIVAIESADEGKTWSAPRKLIDARRDYQTSNVMSCSLLRMQNGDLGLFYIVKANEYTYQVWLSRSNDEGRTFYRNIECSAHRGDGIYVMNNHRVLRLQSGRILIPIAYHRISRLDNNRRYYDFRATTLFLLSDDDGESFRESNNTLYMPLQRSHSGLQEPGAIQLQNGIIWSYMRTDMMFQFESYSLDEGKTWTQAQPSRFTSPCSPMLIERCPWDNALYAIFNPIPEYLGRNAPKEGRGRTPLVYAKSIDDGKTWTDEYIIEDDPNAGYCYPACFFTNDGYMLASYCSGTVEQGSCLVQTTIARIKI